VDGQFTLGRIVRIYVAAAVLLIIGTLGFRLLVEHSWLDSFYRTVVTATLNGLDSPPRSTGGKIWTVFVVLGGVTIFAYVGAAVVEAIAGGILTGAIAERRRWKAIDRLRDHFIICGYGRIGSMIAAELDQQKVPFVIIERSPERVQSVLLRGWLAVAADASRDEVLERVGIHRARGLIAAVGTDAEKVYTVLTARVVRPDLFIVARVESDDAEPKLRRAGADRVISPYHIGATHMAQSALRPAVVDFVQLATSSGHLDLSMEQVKIHEGSGLVGQTIVEAGIRQKFGLIVVAIRRADGTMEFNPSPDSVLRAGDEMVVLGRPQSVKALGERVAA
jgi:voltage-gated potassium channel